MDVSVIIPTYNNCVLLNRTLGNLCNLIQKNIDWEVIVVNNNCSDGTDDVVNLYHDQLPVMLCHQIQQGISIAKNTGLINSSGKLIIFTDDDVRPDSNWLHAYWGAYLEMPEGYFWGGPVVSDFEIAPTSDKLMHYAPPSVAGLYYGDQRKIIEQEKYFIGANWACPRNALNEVGFFDTELGLNASDKQVRVGEETDLMYRLRAKGYSGYYLPEAINYHFVPAMKTTLKHIASRAEAYSYQVARKEFVDKDIHVVPKWVYRKLAESWCSWQFNKIMNKDCTDQYISYRRALGILRAAVICKGENKSQYDKQ
jgi:glucosyl-dolichyl phosphate glucuronosyltransferase